MTHALEITDLKKVIKKEPINFEVGKRYLIETKKGQIKKYLSFIDERTDTYYFVDKKDVSIANILGIRVFFISLIGVALVISFLIDRAHILPLAVIFAVFTIIFSYFETQVLLMLNKKNY